MLILAAGLGNPGAQYHNTRHNAGFRFVNALAEHLGASFSRKKNLRAYAAAHANIRLLRPDTFMNESGQAVFAAAQYFRIPPENILVAHDEADLPPGAAKLKFGGGNAGHNGLESVSKALGGQPFRKLRIGIGRGQTGQELASYVLAQPPATENELVNLAVQRVINIWRHIAAGQWQNAMLSLHSKTETPWDSNAESSDSPTPANPRSSTR